MKLTPLLTVSAGLALASTAVAQNDECATATAVMPGVVAFDTSTASTSLEAWNCGFGVASDLWYSITSTTGGSITFETCGTSFDTVLEAHSGSCGALSLLTCNDDTCGFQSSVSFLGVIGQTYYVRVGGYNGAAGPGTMTISEGAAGSPVTVVSNLPGTFIDISMTGTALSLGDDSEIDIPTTVGNSVLAAGIARVGSNGAVRFDGAGADLGFGNQAIPSTNAFGGDQTLMPFWDDIDTNNGVEGEIYYEEVGGVLIIQWEAVEFFPGGTGGVDIATFQIQVFPGTGPMLAQYLYESVDSFRADTGGSATIGFQSGSFGNYNDAQWSFNTVGSVANGTVLSILAAPAQIGVNFCTANLNSTGVSGVMSATGSANVGINDLTLVGSDLPNNAFGFFIVSATQGFVANPGGSEGNLCLGGAIGRYVGAGQIQNSGTSGEISLLIDNQLIPSPAGFFAVQSGDVLNFQAWHRDSNMGVAVSNFTDGLEVMFN